jgi:uncharacterized membrane protein
VLLFLLILLLVAAAMGVLGAVLKATLVIVLSLVLAVVLLVWFGTWYAKRRIREFQREVDLRIEHARRRRRAYDIDERPADAPRIGDGTGADRPGSA